MSNPKLLIQVLAMAEEEMMKVEIITLYQAFYAMPTTVPPVMCDVKTGKGFLNLTPDERAVAEQIVRVINRRCPMPVVDRYKKCELPAANDPVVPRKLRLSFS